MFMWFRKYTLNHRRALVCVSKLFAKLLVNVIVGMNLTNFSYMSVFETLWSNMFCHHMCPRNTGVACAVHSLNLLLDTSPTKLDLWKQKEPGDLYMARKMLTRMKYNTLPFTLPPYMRRTPIGTTFVTTLTVVPIFYFCEMMPDEQKWRALFWCLVESTCTRNCE